MHNVLAFMGWDSGLVEAVVDIAEGAKKTTHHTTLHPTTLNVSLKSTPPHHTPLHSTPTTNLQISTLKTTINHQNIPFRPGFSQTSKFQLGVRQLVLETFLSSRLLSGDLSNY